MYLQSEAETLQLDGARVWGPWLLTARPGARPAAPPGCLPLEGAPRSRERGAACASDPGGGLRGLRDPDGNAADGSGAAEGGPAPGQSPRPAGGGEPGRREAARSHLRPEAERLAPGGAGVPGEAQGSPALCSPCVTSDFSQAQSLLDEVGP